MDPATQGRHQMTGIKIVERSIQHIQSRIRCQPCPVMVRNDQDTEAKTGAFSYPEINGPASSLEKRLENLMTSLQKFECLRKALKHIDPTRTQRDGLLQALQNQNRFDMIA